MPSVITIRRATSDDARAIATLHIEGWQWAYHGLLPDDYLSTLTDTLERRAASHAYRMDHESPGQRTWVAEEDSRMVGFATAGPSRDEDASPDTGEIGAIYLRRVSAGKGVGRVLLAHTVDELWCSGFKQATLWVLDTNRRACRFYEAAGWLPDGAVKLEERPGFVMRELRYRVAGPSQHTRKR